MYAKIFSQIYDSSIAENYQVRHVFMDLLVLADRDGVLDMTPQAIARRTNIPMKVLMSALSALEQPDDQSRSPEGDGRRITRLDPHRDWGWQIVNFKAYHDLKDEDARRENNRRYQAEHRARLKATSKDLSAPVSTRKRPSAHTDVDVDKEKKEAAAPAAEPAKAKGKRKSPAEKRTECPYYVGYRDAYNAEFAEDPYESSTGDFVQLAAWKEKHPAIPPARFVEVARWHWRADYGLSVALTVKGACVAWSKMVAAMSKTLKQQPIANPTHRPTAVMRPV